MRNQTSPHSALAFRQSGIPHFSFRTPHLERSMHPRRVTALCVLVTLAAGALADGPQDNLPDKVRPVPPAGIKVPDADQQELTSRRSAARQGDRRAAHALKAQAGAARPAARRADLPQRRPLRPDATTSSSTPRRVAGRARSLLQAGAWSGPSSCATARRRGRPRPAWSCAATSRRSTARCSPTAWSCRRRTSRTRRTSTGSTSGATAAARR